MAIRERIAYRLTGEAMVDRYRRTKRRLALSSQEVIAVTALLSTGLALASPWDGVEDTVIQQLNHAGGSKTWGWIFIAIAGPEVIGITLGYLGIRPWDRFHNLRLALLNLNAASFMWLATLHVASGSLFVGTVWSLIFAVTAASAARHVHLYNGRHDYALHLPPEVNAELSKRGGSLQQT